MGSVDGGVAEEVVEDRHHPLLQPTHQTDESHLRMKSLISSKFSPAFSSMLYPGVVVWEDAVADDGCQEEPPCRWEKSLWTKKLKVERFLKWLMEMAIDIDHKRDERFRRNNQVLASVDQST